MSVEKFRFRCIKVLPTVYEDALSYYETLCKVSAKLNEVIEQLNQYDPESVVNEIINDRLNAYTNTTVKPLIAEARAALQANIDNLSDDYYAYKRVINNQIGELNTRLTGLGITVVGIEERCNDYTDQKVAEVVYNLPLMPSPLTGEDVTVFQAINELAEMLKNDSLTAGQYDAIGLPAATYDSKNLTAFQYDWHARTLLA